MSTVSDHTPARKPEWFKIRLDTNENYKGLRRLVTEQNLNTICKEGGCPNIHECWGKHRTAAFMILGDTCTRRCRFCDVKTGKPEAVDLLEPRRVAASVKQMGLDHAFVTMVNRDDLPDGGAEMLANTVRAIKALNPDCSVEVLSSDLMGEYDSIKTVVDAGPEITGHNIETVRRLTPQIRSRSKYERSLRFLEIAKQINSEGITKSSMMLGLGETKEEVLEAMDDLRSVGVDMINIGQYLQPSRTHAPVVRYWHPREFVELRQAALEKGFIHCEAGPLVRSSYHANEQFDAFKKQSFAAPAERLRRERKEA